MSIPREPSLFQDEVQVFNAEPMAFYLINLLPVHNSYVALLLIFIFKICLYGALISSPEPKENMFKPSRSHDEYGHHSHIW